MSTESKHIEKLRGVRGMVADKMVSSLREAAQLTHHASCDATALLAHKNNLEEQGNRCSIEDLLMQVVIQALGRHPHANGHVVDKEVHSFRSVNLSIAIALPGNLLVAPAIFEAEKLNVEELRSARRDLAQRARDNKLSVKEMTGGTFTISNLGLSRVEHFTPILNAPQIGLLGIGCMSERAVKGPEGIEIRSYMGLSLTFDHRAIDGAPAADFLTDICETIEKLGT